MASPDSVITKSLSKSFVGGLLFNNQMLYSVGMDMLMDLRPGKWDLLVLPRSMRDRFLTGLGYIAKKGSLLVLDGGNQFNAYIVSRSVHGRTNILKGIHVSRAFTCYQMVSLLENTPASTTATVCLDFLATFLDESLPVRERQRLLESCLPHFSRLSKSAEFLVTISAPKVMLPETITFLNILEKSAGNIWMEEYRAPKPEPLRLF